jgi:glycine betaine/choline ABC-type transport system substrate-binding protein
MPQLRFDALISDLKRLKQSYPEFANILQMLIDQLHKQKLQILQEKLKSLQREDW